MSIKMTNGKSGLAFITWCILHPIKYLCRFQQVRYTHRFKHRQQLNKWLITYIAGHSYNRIFFSFMTLRKFDCWNSIWSFIHGNEINSGAYRNDPKWSVTISAFADDDEWEGTNKENYIWLAIYRFGQILFHFKLVCCFYSIFIFVSIVNLRINYCFYPINNHITIMNCELMATDKNGRKRCTNILVWHLDTWRRIW